MMHIGKRLIFITTVAALWMTISPGAATATRRPVADTTVLAEVPPPGQPAGIVVDRRTQTIYVSTLGLLQPVPDYRVFAYSVSGELINTFVIPAEHPVSTMALYGLTLDAAGRLYVVDMNGRIVRIDPETGAQDIYATFPPEFMGLTTMPNDIVFDHDGSAYVTDANLAGVWRVPAGGGKAEMWFQDLRLASYTTGPAQMRIDPAGESLYFTLTSSDHPATDDQGFVFRLPTDDPSAENLEQIFSYGTARPYGIALGRTGKLYVTLGGPDQVSILRPPAVSETGWTEELRFPSREENAARETPFDNMFGAALDGEGSLLVTNGATRLTSDPKDWVVFDAFVDDLAAPEPRPVIP